jgi:hypothetical protein
LLDVGVEVGGANRWFGRIACDPGCVGGVDYFGWKRLVGRDLKDAAVGLP